MLITSTMDLIYYWTGVIIFWLIVFLIAAVTVVILAGLVLRLWRRTWIFQAWEIWHLWHTHIYQDRYLKNKKMNWRHVELVKKDLENRAGRYRYHLFRKKALGYINTIISSKNYRDWKIWVTE